METKYYESYQEIHNSYEMVDKTFHYVLGKQKEIREFFRDKNEWVFLASGSSYWMSLSASKMVSFRTGRHAQAVKAADVVMNPQEYEKCFHDPVLVVSSRSGRTQELVRAIEILKDAYPKMKVFSVTEYEKNDILALSDINISIPWANEVSVLQTRSFVCLWAACVAVTVICSDNRKLLEDMERYLENAPALYKKGEAMAKKAVEDGGPLSTVVTLGSGLQYGLVIEGAYIATEMAAQIANYYQLMEYRHGPIVAAGEDVFISICSAGEHTREYETKVAEEARGRGARVAAVTCRDVADAYDYNVSLDGEYEPEIIALYFVFVQQSFAYYLTLKRGLDPDAPKDLMPYISYK